MSVIANLELPLETKQPNEAIAAVFDYLDRRLAGSAPELNLNWFSVSNPGLIINLAKALPPEAEDFVVDFNNKEQHCNAGRALQLFANRTPETVVSFDGTLSNYVPFDACRSFIEQLFEKNGSAVRSTAFSLDVKNIKWSGATVECSSSIRLSDFKPFNRKYRFVINVTVSFEGTDAKSSSIKDSLSEIERTTRIPLSKAKLFVHEPRPEPEKIPKDQALAVGWAFEELFATANLPHNEFDGLMSYREAFDKRFEQWGTPAEKINLPSLIKRWVKTNVSELDFLSADAEKVRFKFPVSDEIEGRVTFERTHSHRIGKAFTISFGIFITKGALKGTYYRHNAFRLLGEYGMPPHWIYMSKADLEIDFVGVGKFLSVTLPVFRTRIAQLLVPLPERFTNGFPVGGNVSCRERFEEAIQLAKKWDSAAFLTRAQIRPILQLRSLFGPETQTDGKISQQGEWLLRFSSPNKKGEFFVEIPYAGTIKSGEAHFSNTFSDFDKRIGPKDVWMDSTQAMETALRLGGQDALRKADETFGILMKLERSRKLQNRLSWRVDFLCVTKKARSDFYVTFDAETGTAVDFTPADY